MIIRRNEAKTLVKQIWCDCKCNCNSATYNSNQRWNNDTCQCECKKYWTWKKVYSWNLNTCISKNSRYLKTISDTLVIVGDEIINVRDSLSINVTQTLPTNVKSTISVNPNDKKTTCEKSNFLVRTKHVRKVISLFALFY